MKKISLASCALLLLSLPTPAQSAKQPSPSVTVQILAINDLHGNLEPPRGAGGTVNGTPAGGTEYLATYLLNARRENPNSILVGVGDLFGASPLLSGLFQDRPAIEAIDAMDLSLTALGNHELDRGPDELKRRLAGGCPLGTTCNPEDKSAPARFTYLAANAQSMKDGQTIFPPTAVRTIGGVKVGFIGEILADAPKVVSTNAVRDIKFLDEVKVANAAAAKLERQGVHTIVLLIHEGGFQHPEAGSPDPNGCANFAGEVKDIASHLSPSIKVVISGHTHVFYNCQLDGRTVTSAGSYGRLFTRISLTIDRRTDRLLNVAATNVVVTRDVSKDPTQTAIIEKYRPRTVRIANAPVGSITADITRSQHTRAEEYALGDVIADAQLAAAATTQNGSAVIAFMNLGGIRAEVVKPAAADGTRPISFGDLYSVQPFGNQLTTITVTGDMLRRLLEQQFAPSGERHILQVSEGFAYQYKSKAPQGEHIVSDSITLHGNPIAPTDKLRIEASDFLVSGGENLTVLHEGTDPVIGPPDIDALVQYFRTHSPVAPGPMNRILCTDCTSSAANEE